jgi:tetratricopeptide (TPR) repeat protein
MEKEVAQKIQAAREEVQRAPESAEAWAALGMVLHAHKLPEAAAAYEQALKIAAKARWHHYLAKILEAEDPVRGLRHAEAAVLLEPSYVPARAQKAYLLEQLGRADEAIRELQEAGRQDPQAAAVWLALGRVQLGKGEIDAAIGSLEQAISIQPHLGSARGLLARALKRKGDTAAAREEAAEARRFPLGAPMSDPWIEEVDAQAVSVLGYLARARRAEREGDLKAAEAHYRHVVEIRPADGDVHFVLGELYLRTRRLPEARAAYERTLEVQAGHAMAHFRLGQIEEFGKNLEKAIAHYRAAASASPEMPVIQQALTAALAKSR